MNVLYLYPFGGLNPKRSFEVMGQGILRELLKRGHKIFVLPRNKEEIEYASTFGLNVLFVKPDNILNKVLRRLLFVSTGSGQIRDLVDLSKLHSINVILERHTFFNVGLEVSKLTSIPYVTNDVISYPDMKYYSDAIGKIQLAVFPESYIKALEARAFRYAGAIISHSLAYSDILRSEYGVDANRIYQFYAMVDQRMFNLGSKLENRHYLGIDTEEFIITYVGGFDTLHTTDLLVPVINYLSGFDIQFVMVGDGPLLDSFVSSVSENGNSSKVIFPGRVGREKVNRYIIASDVCIESIWSERVKIFGADSVKIYEYMACGKPIIASDLPGQIQELSKRNAGILIDPSDTNLFVKTILKLFDDKELCNEMGKNARQLVEESWNWDYTGEVIDKALVAAVAEKTR